MNKYFIKDKNGEPSVTLSAFVLGFVMASLKLLISGVEVAGFTAEKFSGGDYAACLSALGAIYILRRKLGSSNDNSKSE